ncbi:MAG: beta-alanine-activating enzyme beta-propeller domain-containing protein [Ktedonobacterales bacterium]
MTAKGPDDRDETAQLANGAAYQLAPGTLLQSRYRVEHVLGKGGMGHVYVVRDERFASAKSLRSMKEMIPRFSDLHTNMANFEREANVLDSLRHPNIPRVYDSFIEFNRAYLVLEYIEGLDLEQVLERQAGLMPPETVAGWMIQLCDIVGYLHSQNPPVIFRDLKPSNVILTPEGRVMLIDFGIAKVFQTDDYQTNVGTQGYAAPEQYERKAESRSDIYALGAMMHHLLTKTDPRYQAPFSFHERQPRAFNPAITPALEAVVVRCLQHDKEKRYQTVLELRQAIEQAIGVGPAVDNTGYFRSARATGGPRTSWGPQDVANAAFSHSTNVRWRFRTEEEVRSTPTLAGGVLYVGSYDNNLYALDAQSGRLWWKFATEGGICGKAAVWRHLVIVGSEDFNVYGIEASTGKEQWRYRAWHHVRSSPRVFDDRLFVGADDSHMHAIDPRTGRSIWRYRTYLEVQSSAASANGLLYFGSSDNHLYAVDVLTGELKWKHRTQGGIISSPVVADGYVYFGSMDFGIYSLESKSGWLAWREPTERFIISSPLIVGDKLYIGSTDKNLYCIERRTGQRLWRYTVGQQVNSSPAYADGAIYFGCIDGAVYSVDATSGKLRWRFQTSEMVAGSPIVHDGVVYIGSSDGWVYALDANP